MGVWRYVTHALLAACACALFDAALAQEPPRQETPAATVPLVPDRARLRGLLESGNYKKLDAELSAYQEAYRNGLIPERSAARAIWALDRSDPEIQPRFDKWVAEKADSYVAHVARANYFMRRGWRARGTEYAGKTSKAQFDAMGAFFKKAMDDLEIAVKLDPKPVFAYATMIQIARAGGEREEITRYLERAIQIDLRAYSARWAYLNAITPEWGGSVERMEAAVESWRLGLDEDALRRLELIVQDAKWRIALRPAADLVEKKRYQEAIALYDQALAQAPVVRAYTMRGHSYMELGQYDKALEDYNRSLELDPESACCSGTRAGRGELYLKMGAIDKALPDLVAAATQNENDWAARELAMIYAFGKYGFKVDYEAARQWCERSAKGGDGLSMYCMANLYYWGIGVDKDPAQAEKWYLGAAERGISDAQTDLGYFYWQGDGGSFNAPQALYWWQKAAIQGNSRALYAFVPFLLVPGLFIVLFGIGYSRRRKKARSRAQG